MKILVVCRCESKHEYKIGNVEFKVPEYPLSIEGIREIKRQIKERLQVDSVVVLNVNHYRGYNRAHRMDIQKDV